jgi:hypothetical protein
MPDPEGIIILSDTPSPPPLPSPSPPRSNVHHLLDDIDMDHASLSVEM